MSFKVRVVTRAEGGGEEEQEAGRWAVDEEDAKEQILGFQDVLRVISVRRY